MHVYHIFIDVTIKYMLVLFVYNYDFIFFYLGDNTGPVNSYVIERDFASFESLFRFDLALDKTPPVDTTRPK